MAQETNENIFIEEEYANLFGIRALQDKGWGCFPVCPQMFRRKNAEEVERNFGAGIPKGQSCEGINTELNRIQNEMNAIRGRITSGATKGSWHTTALGALENKKKDANNRYNEKKCAELKIQQEKEAEEKKNVKLIQETAKSATQEDPLAELQKQIMEKKLAAPDYTKYIAIGIAGIFVLGSVFLLLKPKKAAAPSA
jgi:hypothetical protein